MRTCACHTHHCKSNDTSVQPNTPTFRTTHPSNTPTYPQHAYCCRHIHKCVIVGFEDKVGIVVPHSILKHKECFDENGGVICGLIYKYNVVVRRQFSVHLCLSTVVEKGGISCILFVYIRCTGLSGERDTTTPPILVPTHNTPPLCVHHGTGQTGICLWACFVQHWTMHPVHLLGAPDRAMLWVGEQSDVGW